MNQIEKCEKLVCRDWYSPLVLTAGEVCLSLWLNSLRQNSGSALVYSVSFIVAY